MVIIFMVLIGNNMYGDKGERIYTSSKLVKRYIEVHCFCLSFVPCV